MQALEVPTKENEKNGQAQTEEFRAEPITPLH